MDYLSGAVMMPHPPIIVPEVGGDEGLKAKATVEGMKKAATFIEAVKPDTIVILSPHGLLPFKEEHRSAHNVYGDPTIKGNFKKFGDNSVEISINIDTDFAQALTETLNEQGIISVLFSRDALGVYGIIPEIDHGSLVPLYYLKALLGGTRFVLVTTGYTDREINLQAGNCIRAVAEKLGRKTLILASGDLSHRLKETGPYGYDAEGPVFDQKIVAAFESGKPFGILEIEDKSRWAAGECGFIPYSIALGAFKDLPVKSEVYSYEGPFGVGYMVGTLKCKEKSAYVRLAEEAVRSWVIQKEPLRWESYKNDHPLEPEFIQAVEMERAGVFVSIHKHGGLRGCIGTISPVKECVAKEIIANAIEACAYDPRFSPVSQEELGDLAINVDILSAPEVVSGLKDLDIKKYGVIVSYEGRKGLLLPDLEGVDTVEQQVQIAMQKAGIDLGLHQLDQITLARFQVTRYE